MTRRYVVGENVEDPEMEEETAEMKSILGEAMEDAWRRPEARKMKRKLSKVAKQWWKPQIEEALETTKYAEELKARAREINYGKKVEEAWK